MQNTLQDILRVSAQFFGLTAPDATAPADEAEVEAPAALAAG